MSSGIWLLLASLIIGEISLMAPQIALRLAQWGARRLGSQEAIERYSEEWAANLEHVPGHLTKLTWACGLLLWTVPTLRWRSHRRSIFMCPILVAGSVDEVAYFIDRTRRKRRYGWMVTGACVPGFVQDRPREVSGVPVLGGLADVADLVRESNYRAVALAPDPYWNRQQIRQLARDLERMAAKLVVAPALIPLLHASQPTFTGVSWFCKATIDRLGALLVLALLFLPMLLVAGAIKIEDGGPVLFWQHRTGKAGKLFWMAKFRSIVVNAEQWRTDLDVVDEAAGPLFKIWRDPRVTRVGTFLRRYSLDELPQLINVLRGEMSLVGPRPPLPAEVAVYSTDAKRRLLVKPGMTGLWQVSGRSDLSWEEAVRLDLRYVENWSLALDAMICWKTVSAVLGGRGAY